MINQTRVTYMTRLAIQEKHQGEDLEMVQTYFRSDYLGLAMMKNGLRVTVAFFIGLLFWGCYHMEALLAEITSMDIPVFVMQLAATYFAVLCVSLVITYVAYAIKYTALQKEQQQYEELLKRLLKEYDGSSRNRRRPEGEIHD